MLMFLDEVPLDDIKSFEFGLPMIVIECFCSQSLKVCISKCICKSKLLIFGQRLMGLF